MQIKERNRSHVKMFAVSVLQHVLRKRCGNYFMKLNYCNVINESKGKAVPQHTYGGTGGRGGIAPTHS
jgi:hypothetical protein